MLQLVLGSDESELCELDFEPFQYTIDLRYLCIRVDSGFASYENSHMIDLEFYVPKVFYYLVALQGCSGEWGSRTQLLSSRFPPFEFVSVATFISQNSLVELEG